MMSEITSTVRRMKTPDLVKSMKRYIPDSDQMEQYLRADSEELISHFFPARKKKAVRSAASVNKAKGVLEVGLRALEKIRAEGEQANLDYQERDAVGSIIVNFGRPAFLIQDGCFPSKSGGGGRGGLPPNWWILEDYREDIQNTCKSVGRIEHYEKGHRDAPGGTGFLVAEDVVMTNHHVANYFCYEDNMTWVIREKTKPRIDYFEEFGSKIDCEFAVKEIIGIHDTFDMALLRVEKTSSQGASLPEPLILDSKLPDPIVGRKVYVVGYPFQSSPDDNPQDVNLVFNNLLGYKRLQPGEATGVESQGCLLYHDCSTIEGNSGSCVVDLEKNTVIGLHFSGKLIKECNEAIALPMLKNDKMLLKAGVNFR
jgi:V8-like Glu-specific endopeptidase